MFSVGQRWALLAGFTLLVIFRLPHAWVHGRFLDEEATVFLAYAWHRPWLDALFRPFAGYWNLGANATTLLVARLVQSGVVPLERAPYLTMIMALAVQMLPAVLILTGRAQWLAGRLAVVTALLMIAIMPGTEEVFFNVLHIQFHLALCVALILALDIPERRSVQVGYGVILFLAPLCGPGAIVLLPLFALRALVDRDIGRLWLLAPLAAGTAIQLLFFYGASPLRGHVVDVATLAAVFFARLIARPMLGLDSAQRLGIAIFDSQAAGGANWWWSVGLTVALLGLPIWQAARRRDAALWLIVSGLCLAILSFGFGMVIVHPIDRFTVSTGERYDFLPLVLLGLALVVLAMRPQGWSRPIYAALCAAVLWTCVADYRHPLEILSTGPSWPAEVAAWRRDHSRPLAVWPSRMAADLSDGNTACTPIGRDLSTSTDPRYCESGWVAGYYRPEK